MAAESSVIFARTAERASIQCRVQHQCFASFMLGLLISLTVSFQLFLSIPQVALHGRPSHQTSMRLKEMHLPKASRLVSEQKSIWAKTGLAAVRRLILPFWVG